MKTNLVAIAFLISMGTTNRGLCADNWMASGLWAAAQGQYRQAIDSYDKAIAQKSDLSSAYHNRGDAHFHLQQFRAAIADFTASIKEGGAQNALNYLNRGAAYAELGDWKSCLADCNRGLDIFPQSPSGYGNRGEAKLRLGQAKAAISDLNKAILIDQSFAEPYYFRGQAYEKLGEKQRAQQDFKKASQLGYKPKDSIHVYKQNWSASGGATLGPDNLAQILGAHKKSSSEMSQELRTALAAAEKSSGLDSEQTAEALLKLAGCYKDSSMFSEAEPLYTRALSICDRLPENNELIADTTFGLADLYCLESRFSDAEPLLKRAKEAREKLAVPNDAKLQLILETYAKSLYKLNRAKEGDELYERLRSLKK